LSAELTKNALLQTVFRHFNCGLCPPGMVSIYRAPGKKKYRFNWVIGRNLTKNSIKNNTFFPETLYISAVYFGDLIGSIAQQLVANERSRIQIRSPVLALNKIRTCQYTYTKLIKTVIICCCFFGVGKDYVIGVPYIMNFNKHRIWGPASKSYWSAVFYKII